ncbi:MAG TPA: hypothetical protein VJ259_00755 [Actinomycetota bacterium]|nr:hypothetical protein [Actinomycetota bacterium]
MRSRFELLVRIAAVLPQVSISPNASPTINTGGWVYGMAVLLVVLGIVVTLLIVFGYMRYAPRFQRAEGEPRTVKAPSVQPGKEVRRPVKITGAPVVAPPPVPVAAAAPAASAAQAVAAPTATPAAAAPQGTAGGPPAASVAAEAPAAPPPAAEASAAPAPAAAPAAGEHREVPLDQETFEKTLAELLEKGTDRRVAEGQARRVALIAARKKAGG